MERTHRRAAIGLAILLACCSYAFALDPSLDVSQYAHTAWKARDGFSKGAITSIAQMPDGYLWLGTEFGLLRFDGVRAVPWQPPAGEQLPSSNIRTLLAARNGTLWIGTRNGLASWKDGKLTAYPSMAGQAVFALLEDRQGTLWAGASSLTDHGRLCAIRGGGSQCYGEDGSLGPAIMSLYEDGKGGLWVGVINGFWRWKPGPSEFYSIPGEPSGIRTFAESDEGALLIGSRAGIERLVDGRIDAYSVAGPAQQFRVDTMLRDRAGSFWIGTERGLVHIHQGKSDRFSQVDGLSGDPVTRLLEDREGNIWVATTNGLDRFRSYAVPTISLKQGLSDAIAVSVLAARDGGVWVGTANALNRWDHGEFTLFASHKGAQKGDGKLNGRAPNTLFEDHSGRMWVSTDRELGYLENGRFIPLPDYFGGYVYSVAEVGPDQLWVTSQQAGLLHLSHGKVVQQIPWAGLGHKISASALAADPAGHGFWLGFFEGGVAYFADGGIQQSYSTSQGLGDGIVNGLRFGPRGSLWAATEGGLSRIKDGHVATLTSKNGLPCDAVHWTMEDDDHAVWLYMRCGVVRIERTEMDAWVADPKRLVRAAVLDNSDGVPTQYSAGGFVPHVSKSGDGRLWFTTYDGVSVIDPRHLAFNKLPPPVHIEQIVADSKTYWQNWSGNESSSKPKLPPLVRNLVIDYTALSLVVPEKVRFRFKLEGQDTDWREVVNSRRVEYSNLPPRNYRFRVIASNNSGVWNEEGASLDFAIAPAYYQTNWFRVLCAVAFLALLWALYKLRIQQVRHEERKLRDVVETIPAIAWTARPDGWVDFSNHHWEEYTGLPIEKGAGAGWEAAVHPEDVKRHTEKWRASVASGEPFENEARYRRADGEYRWFLVRAVPLRDGGGKTRKWYGTKTDIEDRKRAEQLQADLTHASRISTMGELVASISHELAQPLQVTTAHAKASLRWLQRDPPNVTEARKGTETIIEAGTLASEIINRLRSLYKKASPKRELVAMNEVVREMSGMLRSEARSHGVSVRTDLKDDLPKTVADRVQLQQVLMNLMLNGIEAMKDTGGVLTVKSQLDGDDQLLISVSDTGVGLPVEKSAQIFDAFFTTKTQGSGMGLAISRSIVDSHGGRLWATANDGRGATFYFTLRTASEEVKVPGAVT